METLQNLSAQVTNLTEQLRLLDHSATPEQPSVSTAPSPPPAPVSPHHSPHKEPYVPSPEPYAGEIGGASGFVLRCSLVFDQQPLSYPTDRAKIAYTVNLLRGRAAQWATALWEQESPILSSFDNFTGELCRIFDHPRQGQEAAKRLLSLVQGSRSVADFSIDFRIAASESGWGELELKGVFLRGLSSELKDELASRDEPDSLESLISLAICIDNRLRERRQEKMQTSSTRDRELAPPVVLSASPGPPSPPQAHATPNASPVEPMQLGRARLHPSECHLLWPGGALPGFLSPDAKRADSPVNESALVSQTSPSSSARITVPSCLLWGRESLPLKVLIDSGADESFIHDELATQLNLPLEPLSTPRNVTALDGRLIAQVKFRTVPVTLIISGNHREDIQLLVIPSPHVPLVLGFPWLLLHNPQIDWKASSITNWSPHCHSQCLRSANPFSPRPPVTPSTPPDLTSVPPEYHDLAPVFSKELALSLPPHWPYDCSIDLLPGAPLPSSRLYNLSRPEKEAMEAYIQDSLASGLIRPSSSPLGAGFFFVKKKDASLRPCIDFRGLNDITVKNKYSLPLIDPSFEPLCSATVFTKLDLRNAYHLIRIKEGDEWKTAFNTPLGHFEYQVMPFGLTNAPAVFQALINDMLRDMLNRFVFVYLDDILIFFPHPRGAQTACPTRPPEASGEQVVRQTREM